ncbi:MAG TPA: hypothetical protein VF841_04560, partial [Anaeromyxobacter sp.]
AATASASAAASAADVPSPGSAFAFAGRTLLVLAGAFVLRALTDSGTLAAPLGVGLGLVYAGTWIALADRAGKAGASWSAGFHGATAAMIGFPLLFEATFRFKLLSPATASGLLAALTAVALAVAARRRLEGLAWLVSLAGAATAAAVALAPLTGRATFPALYVTALGVATLWLGYVLDWHGPRWPIAIVADVLVGVVALRARAAGGGEDVAAAYAVQAVLLVAYLGSIAARTLLLGRRVVPFEMFQAAAALAVGLGGAATIASRGGGAVEVGFGLVAVACGLAAYGVAFRFVERRQKGSANFWFYSSAAIVLVLAGTALVLSGPALPLAWAASGAVAAALGRRSGRITLATHGAAYGVAATLAAGLLSHAAETSFTSPDQAWDAPGLAGVAVLAIAIATVWFAAAPPRVRVVDRLPQAILVGIVACAAAGVAIGWLVPLVAGVPGAGAAPGAVATVRTAVWVAGALALTCLGRCTAFKEAGWLVYPALGAIGLKILLEDLQRSRPATLFLAFALYGGALIVVSRVRHRPREAHGAGT